MAQARWTILELIRWTEERLRKEGVPAPRLDAEVLLAAALGKDRVWLYTHFDQPLDKPELACFREFVRRRLKREPVAYITGSREFWSLSFKVTPDVLIPRPETEILVSEALKILRRRPAEGLRIWEIGTGSGAVTVALAREFPGLSILATDLSEKALAVARENAERHGVLEAIQFRRGDLFIPLTKEDRFSMILTNPPYIPGDQFPSLPPEVRNHEPHLALDGGRDGLDFYRRALPRVDRYLDPGGWFLAEIGAGEEDRVLALARENPALEEMSFVPDLAGIKRVFKARKKW